MKTHLMKAVAILKTINSNDKSRSKRFGAADEQ